MGKKGGTPRAERPEKTHRVQLRKVAAEMERLSAIRREHVVPVDQPLVLIGQPARSGGTLLSQLLDGHPELHAHPHELEFGQSQRWPTLDPQASPDEWLGELRERHVTRAFREGYAKDRPAQKLGYVEQLERFPFAMPPLLLRDLFLGLVSERKITSAREVLDACFTAYFNAWLDNQNLYGETGGKRWIVAFRGRLALPANIARFFHDYDDGRHITIVREPKSWITSRAVYRGEPLVNLGDPLDLWTIWTRFQLDTKSQYGEQVLMLTYEQLVEDTRAVMSRVADWLGIRFDPILCEPTFNRMPIKANSSFRVDGHGVIRDSLDRWRDVLTKEQAAAIDDATRDVRALVSQVADLQG